MRAVVTGAGGRVGQAIALELGRSGFEVAVHYRSSREGAEETVAALRELGADGWTVQADLSKVDDVRRLVDAVRTRWDALDVLVHNASVFRAAPVEEITLDHFELMMAVHAKAPLLLTQGLLAQLRAGGAGAGRLAGEGGLIVNLLDVGAERPISDHAAYTASKAALLGLTRAFAVELAPAVRCVGVSPGQVAWPPDYSDDTRRRIASRIPMGRVGTPEDVARLVRFLALEAPYLNGIVVPVDGGITSRY